MSQIQPKDTFASSVSYAQGLTILQQRPKKSKGGMASGPFVCCRELLPPSCLEHCVLAQLWSDHAALPQLVAASFGQVYIYSQVQGKQVSVCYIRVCVIACNAFAIAASAA